MQNLSKSLSEEVDKKIGEFSIFADGRNKGAIDVAILKILILIASLLFYMIKHKE